MRWVRLTEEESRVCRAPQEVDALGSLSLSMFGEWRKDALFMILTAYIDESGMGGEEHLTMGGFVFKLGRYQEFVRRWNKLLDRKEFRFPYANLKEMLGKDGPFKNTDSHDVWRFYDKGLALTQRFAAHGVTVTMDRNLFRKHYKNRFEASGGDSEFGLAARVTIQYLTGYFDKHAGVNEPCLNMIFDQQQQFGGAAKHIFYETKRLYDDGKRVLGNFGFGENQEICGLQMADFIVSVARKVEPRAITDKARLEVTGPLPKVDARTKAPILHVPIGEDAFDLFVGEQADLKRLRGRQRWLEKQIRKAESAASA